MLIALLNDTHFGAIGDNPAVNDYFHRFYNDIFFPYIEKHNIKTLVHLGDVVDRRKFVNYATWNSWRTKFFDRLLKNNIDVHMLTGNHDCYYRNTNEVNALGELCSGYRNITIYTGVKDVMFGSLSIAMVPWINTGNYEESLKFLNTTTSPVIFGHLEIAGFQMDQGNVCLVGMDRSVFERFDMVISGHFHHRSSDGLIFYLGNQVEITWADYNDPRGFHIFDTETRDLTFIENPYKLFHKLIYDDSVQNFEYWKNQDFKSYENSYVKIVVTRKQNSYLFDTVMNMLYKASPQDVTVVEDYTEPTLEAPADGVNQAEDTITIIRKCVDGMTMPGTVKPDKLKGILQEMYVEAVNEETAIL
jgi:DNA repair exonuclease SbcCD nuclease subunit